MNRIHLTLLLLVTALAGCGLTASDAERIAQADAAMADGDFRAANIELRGVLIHDPDNLQARLKLANVSLGLNDPESARKEMLRAADLGAPAGVIQELNVRILALEGQNLEVLAALSQDDSGIPELVDLRYRGEALIALQNGEAALANYRRWQALEPDSPDAAVGLARAEAVSGRILDALADVEAVLAAHAEHAGAWQAMGMLRFRIGEYSAARDAYRKALEFGRPREHIRQYLTTLLGLADAELMLENADGARRVISQLAAVAPESTQVLFQKARLAQLEQDYYAAADALRELLVITPNDPRALMFLANVQNRLGSVEQAEVLYRRVVALAPDNTQARKRLAELQLRQSNSAAAVEVLAPLTGGANEDPDISRLLAIASFQQGDSAAAIEQLETALGADPGNLNRKIALAEAYLRSGQPAKVVALFGDHDDQSVSASRLLLAALGQQDDAGAAGAIADRLIAEHGDDAEALSASAAYYRSIGELDRAEALLNRSLELDAGNARTNVQLAIIADQSGRHEIAIQRYRQALDQDAANLPALLALAQDASKRGDRATAIDFLERARAAHPGQIAPRLLLASLYYKGGDLEQTEAVAREMAAIGSGRSPINTVIGNLLIETGALEEALTVYGIAVRQDPDSVQALIGLARGQMALGRSEDARVTLARTLEIDPGNVLAVPAMALVELRLGDPDAARRRLEAHVAAHPADINGRLVSGDVYDALGDYDKAIDSYRAAAEAGAGATAVLREYHARVTAGRDPVAPLRTWLASHPDDAAVRAQMAEYFQANGDRQAAMREYESLLGSDGTNPVYLNNLAWEYQQSGELDRALELALKAKSLRPDSGSISDTLGWIYHERGELQKSEDLLRFAVKTTPGNGDIAYHLAATLAKTGKREEAANILTSLLDSDTRFSAEDAARALLATL